jgi:uncharacterized protein YuzB (UPF0349 family)
LQAESFAAVSLLDFCREEGTIRTVLSHAYRQVNESMKPLVEFCANNVSSYSKSVLEALENNPELDADVLEYGCLGHCGECYMKPFALVNGNFVSAETVEEFWEKIKAKLREEEEMLDEGFPF